MAAARNWVREPEVGAEDILIWRPLSAMQRQDGGPTERKGYEALDAEPRTSGSAR